MQVTDKCNESSFQSEIPD